jgi:hypothetical protein
MGGTCLARCKATQSHRACEAARLAYFSVGSPSLSVASYGIASLTGRWPRNCWRGPRIAISGGDRDAHHRCTGRTVQSSMKWSSGQFSQTSSGKALFQGRGGAFKIKASLPYDQSLRPIPTTNPYDQSLRPIPTTNIPTTNTRKSAHVMDNSDTRRSMRRPRDQRVSSGRVLIVASKVPRNLVFGAALYADELMREPGY